jgi:hypothetical protein
MEKKPKKQDSPVCVYDITASPSKISKDDLIKWMKLYCKKWVFQLEEAPTTGKKHFQCRVSLGEKRRINQVMEMIYGWGHASVTSSENRDNNFYVTKEETRVEGPWSDDETPLFVQARFRGIIKWKPWQTSVLTNLADIPEYRTINMIIETEGNKGKTFLCMYCLTNKLGRMLPPLNDYKEIVQAVMDMPDSPTYFIDVPRSLDKKHFRGFFGAIEQIKNGYVFDCRYHYKEKIIEAPHIWVFSNQIPDISYLSADRWKFWKINKKDELVPLKVKVATEGDEETTEEVEEDEEENEGTDGDTKDVPMSSEPTRKKR